MHRPPTRLAAVLFSLPLLTACGDDEGPTGPDPLTRDEVAGFYEVCTLSFTPEGSLQPVDIRAAAFELSNPQIDRPLLAVDPTGSFELEYTPKGKFTDEEVRGTVDPRVGTVELRFGNNGVAPATLLLPGSVSATYQPSPRALLVEPSDRYEVPRADYARLGGFSESGLADRIPGRLRARFAAPGGCG
jgi:hypothetical protein